MSLTITVVRADERAEQVIETTTTGLDLFGEDRSIVAMHVDGETRDLSATLPEGADAQTESERIPAAAALPSSVSSGSRSSSG